MSLSPSRPSLVKFLVVLVLCTAAANLFVWLMVAHSILQSRQTYQERAEVTVGNLTQVLEQYFTGALRLVDTALTAVDEEIARGVRGDALERTLERKRAQYPEIMSLFVVDADGNVLYGKAKDSPPINVSDRAYFPVIRTAPVGTVMVTEPVLGRIANKWALPVVRRLGRPDGSFAGVVVASVSLERLARAFAQLDTGEHGVSILFDAERRMVVRHPELRGPGSAVGLKIGSPQIIALMQAGGDSATYRAQSTTDGYHRTYSYRKIPGHPLYVNVGLAEEDYLAEWRASSLMTAGSALAFTFATVLSSAALYLAWRRQKQLVGKLSLSEEELKRSNVELEQFAYVASHDLREPLRMVSSYLGLLERRCGTCLDTDGHEFLGYAKEGAQRMDRLVLDLLELSRIDRLGSPMVEMRVERSIDDAIANLSLTIADAGAEVSVEGASALPAVQGDPAQITLLFQNLIGNAIKYRAPDRPPRVRVICRHGDGQWEVCVADNGIGIESQYYDRVFRIFQRLHARDKYDGTGIGLAICKKIVERHGGRIWIESAPDEGSKFFCVLRVDAAPARGTQPAREDA